jgi:V/A-type H+-transporting ATPase subunit K
MYALIVLLALTLFGTLAVGVYFEMFPALDKVRAARWLKGTFSINVLTFVSAMLGIVLLGMHDVLAESSAAGPAVISDGLGLALIGIGIPTGLAAIGAGIAVGPVGAASLAIISEKPEMFGRTLIYLGLAEGIAIYGLVVTILLLGKIG